MVSFHVKQKLFYCTLNCCAVSYLSADLEAVCGRSCYNPRQCCLPSIWPTIYFCLTFHIRTGTASSLCILSLNTHTYTVGVRRLIMDYCLWLFFSLFRLEMRHQTIHYSQELTNHRLLLPRLLTQALLERNWRIGRKWVQWGIGLDESR